LYALSPTEQILLARKDFNAFRWYVKAHKSYTHHQEWERYLNTGLNSRCLNGIAGDDLLILAPRGSSKSTFLIEWVAYQIGRHAAPEIRQALMVLYVSYELKTARQKSQQIKRLLTLPEYRRVFPWIRPGENWANELWEIDFAHAGLPRAEEPYTVAAAGLIGNVTGKRCHISVYDDLIKSPEAIANPDIREQMVSNYRNIIKPTRFDGARSICLGTRMRPDDIYCTEFTSDNDWQVVEQSAILDLPDGGECSYWEPEDDESPGQTLVFLQSIREKEPETFSYQYQNKVIRIATQAITPELIVRGIILSQMDYLALGVDLSAGEREVNDYTAFVLGGMARDEKGRNRYFIIDCWEDRLMGNMKKLEAIAVLYDCWRHLCPYLELFVESNGYQLSFAGDYQDFVAEEEYYDWRVTAVHSAGNKLERLRGVTGLLENKLVTFNQYGRLMGKLTLQLTNHGSTSHDDLADAFEKCLRGLRARSSLTGANY
jgi:phage terminase large subunit-like protein